MNKNFTPRALLFAMLLATCATLSAWSQKALPSSYFAGLALRTDVPLGDSGIVAASLAEMRAQGIAAVRVAVGDTAESCLARLDTLLAVCDTVGLDVFLAVPDTLAMDLGPERLHEVLSVVRRHRLKAVVLVCGDERAVRCDEPFAARLSSTFPDQLFGISVSNAHDGVAEAAARWPFVDFIGLRLGYREQRWASLDRVREAMGQVFVRLPQVLQSVVQALELSGKPLVIDYVDYPRDRAFHTSGSSTQIRDNVVSFLRDAIAAEGNTIRGMFLGEFVGDENSIPRQPTETVYPTDTSTIRLLVQKTPESVQ